MSTYVAKPHDIETLAAMMAKLQTAPPMQDAFRDDVRTIVSLRSSGDLKGCALSCIARMTEYDLLWLGCEHDDLQALGQIVRMRVTQEQVRDASRWFGSVYHECRAAMGFEPLEH